MILIVSATHFEVELLLQGSLDHPVGIPFPVLKGIRKDVELLITGVGAVPTTYHLIRTLNQKEYELVVSIGIAGSYKTAYSLGDTVIISRDTFADYGIDNRGNFSSLFESGLCDANSKPFIEGKLIWPYVETFKFAKELPSVKAITVSTASGSQERISDLVKMYSPDIETMEGAAIFYSCLMSGLPFVCLRAISNFVEPRDTSRWELSRTINNLCEQTLRFIGSL